MQNYEFLKQAGKTDDEIFDLLLSKDTQSDVMERYQDAVLSLFNKAREDAANANVPRDDLLEQARADAAQIIFQQPSAGTETGQTVTLDP